jgi:hypothetical protein
MQLVHFLNSMATALYQTGISTTQCINDSAKWALAITIPAVPIPEPSISTVVLLYLIVFTIRKCSGKWTNTKQSQRKN